MLQTAKAKLAAHLLRCCVPHHMMQVSHMHGDLLALAAGQARQMGVSILVAIFGSKQLAEILCRRGLHGMQCGQHNMRLSIWAESETVAALSARGTTCSLRKPAFRRHCGVEIQLFFAKGSYLPCCPVLPSLVHCLCHPAHGEPVS